MTKLIVRSRRAATGALTVVVAVIVALAITGCGSASEGVAVGGVTVGDAWARPTPPDTDRTAIYGVVSNDGSDTDRLTGVSTDRCATTELHTTVTDDGVAMMRPADESALTIEPDDELGLQPGGLHAMCLGVTEPLAEGDRFTATFEFGSSRTVDVDVVVEHR